MTAASRCTYAFARGKQEIRPPRWSSIAHRSHRWCYSRIEGVRVPVWMIVDDQHRYSNISASHAQMVSSKPHVRHPPYGASSLDNCMLFTRIDIFRKACYPMTLPLLSVDSHQGMMNSTAAFNSFTGVATICLSTSYGIPILVSILRGRKLVKNAPFSLGKFGMVINILTIFWIVLAYVNCSENHGSLEEHTQD